MDGLPASSQGPQQPHLAVANTETATSGDTIHIYTMTVRTRRAAAKEEEQQKRPKWAAHSGKNAAVGFVATVLLIAVLFFSWFRLVGGFGVGVVAPPLGTGTRMLSAGSRRSSSRRAAASMALSGLPLSPVFLLLASSQSPAALGSLMSLGGGGGGSGGGTVLMLAGGSGAGGGVGKGAGSDALAGLEDEVGFWFSWFVVVVCWKQTAGAAVVGWSSHAFFPFPPHQQLAEEFGGSFGATTASAKASAAGAGNSKAGGANGRVKQQAAAAAAAAQQQQASTADPLSALLSGQGARGRSIEPRAHSL